MPRTRGHSRRRRLLGITGGVIGIAVIAGIGLWWWAPWWPAIQIASPGPTGQRITADGIFANYYPAHRYRTGPAVLLLGGSEGGISKSVSEEAVGLQSEGLSVLALGYFGVPGQPQTLERVPLETFDRALAWLRAQPDVDVHAISVFGTSKGAEAALLVGARHPELRAVVAGSPSSVVWPGVNKHSLDPASSWTVHGRELAVLPYGPLRPSLLLGHLGSLYREGLKKLGRHPYAVIPVERIRATVLLICGQEDSLWPSCEMAHQVEQRARQMHGPHVTVLAYVDAGHLCVGVPLSRTSSDFSSLSRWGGTAAANDAARADSWAKLVDLLRG